MSGTWRQVLAGYTTDQHDERDREQLLALGAAELAHARSSEGKPATPRASSTSRSTKPASPWHRPGPHRAAGTPYPPRVTAAGFARQDCATTMTPRSAPPVAPTTPAPAAAPADEPVFAAPAAHWVAEGRVVPGQVDREWAMLAGSCPWSLR
ncbi:hypothetical protein ACFWM7_33190 [Streptomyces sp. NPDC058375]|uniref:hypothetical protein n=1 Tax=Streptomyces sp. NPDC058375 TaxID=3346467 RepID=UPI00364CFDCC